jgi:hypothetical protein
MTTSKECIELININRSELESRFEVKGMSLFGSVAKGCNTSESDIDILVDMPPKILLMSDLKLFLEKLFHCPVDLIRRHTHLSSGFITEITKDAITIF